MKRAFTHTMILAALVIAAIGTSAFAFPHKDGDDLDTKVAKRIRYVDRYGVFDYITFDVSGGVVTLTGKVNSIGTIQRAKLAVQDIKGVTQVVNNLEQLPGSSFDDGIRRAMLRDIYQRGPSQYFSDIAPDVHIIVENGHVTLEGTVSSKSHSDVLNIIANGVPGVFSVTNNIVVGKPAFR